MMAATRRYHHERRIRSARGAAELWAKVGDGVKG